MPKISYISIFSVYFSINNYTSTIWKRIIRNKSKRQRGHWKILRKKQWQIPNSERNMEPLHRS